MKKKNSNHFLHLHARIPDGQTQKFQQTHLFTSDNSLQQTNIWPDEEGDESLLLHELPCNHTTPVAQLKIVS